MLFCLHYQASDFGESPHSAYDEEPRQKPKGLAETIDLQNAPALAVDISDALSEQDKIKFTVHTKTALKSFKAPEFTCVREHEEFVWLHDSFEDNKDFAGIIIPPAPPKPDFSEPREKLVALREGEDHMTKEEYSKKKQELESEYLATFKKTVAMHEAFLQRIAAHPVLYLDHNFQTFLEYDQELSIRGKNAKEKIGSLWKGLSKSVDETLVLRGQKDVDEWFDKEKIFLVDYGTNLRNSIKTGDKMTSAHKELADSFIGVSEYLKLLPINSDDSVSSLCQKTSELYEKLRKSESRVSSDEDLKLSDLMRYYERESRASLDLLYRRTRCLANFESANKKLEQAKAKNKGVQEAEALQQEASAAFEKLSAKGKEELQAFKVRRVEAFRKNLTELVDLEAKHAKAQVAALRATLAALREL